MPSPGRLLHQAARVALAARFDNSFTCRLPYSSLHPSFISAVSSWSRWPSVADYDHLASCVPQATGVRLPHFVLQRRETLARPGGYERHVAETGEVPTRERSWHDFFNMAVWAHFPRLRWALNRAHTAPPQVAIDPRNGRSPRQNVASQLDESGIIVASSRTDLLDQLRALQFKTVLWKLRRELLATSCIYVVGHGTLESLLSPHPGLACKAVLLDLPRPAPEYDANRLRFELDERVAAIVEAWGEAPPRLDPLPVLGVPGYADNERAEFYDDPRYFRFQRAAEVKRGSSSALSRGGSGTQ